MIREILIKHHNYIYSKKPKRGGGGKFNVGTIQDELKEADVQKGEEEEIQNQEAPKDEGITLEEYYKLKGYATKEEEAKTSEPKSKVPSDQLIKELGKATFLQNKVKTQINDHEAQKKKKDTGDHAVAINTEHADLLGI